MSSRKPLLSLLALSLASGAVARAAEPAAVADLVETWAFLAFHETSWRTRAVDADQRLLSALQATEGTEAWRTLLGPTLPPDIDLDAPPGQVPTPVRRALERLPAPPVPEEHPWVSLPRHRPVWHPPTHSDASLPDAPIRQLAVARLWAALRWGSPYLDDPTAWRNALPDALAQAVAASTPEAYHQALERLLAQLRDGHGAIEGPSPRAVSASTPFALRSDPRGGAPFVLRVGPDAPPRLRPGDRVVAVDGVPWSELAEREAPFAQGGTDANWVEDRDQRVLEALDGEYRLTLSGPRGRHHVTTSLGRRAVFPRPHALPPRAHWRDGQVHVVDLQRLHEDGLGDAMEGAVGARALLFDLRGYPPYLPQQLASCISDVEVPTHRFGVLALERPGTTDAVVQAYGGAHCPGPRFDGPVGVLLDRHTFSRGEYIAMVLEAVPRVVSFGEPTAGVDGDRVGLPLPGRVTAHHSGLGIAWPDGRPTQRIGIVPDVAVPVTRRGVRRGHDEPMEVAVATLASP